FRKIEQLENMPARSRAPDVDRALHGRDVQDARVEATLPFIDAVSALMQFRSDMAEAKVILSGAMVTYVSVEGRASFRAACKAVLVCARLVEKMANVLRSIAKNLQDDVADEEIAAAIQYARECRAEIGFCWRFRWWQTRSR